VTTDIEEPKTLADSAFTRIRADIVSGALKPGEKLKISELVTRYDVGASPLREALARLSSEFLVVLEGQRGFTVAAISQEELLDISALRQMLEAEAVAQAVQRGDVAWESRIVASYYRLQRADAVRKSGGGSAEWENANRDFHDTINAACGSPWLLRMQKLLFDQHERYRRFSLSHQRTKRDLDAEHRAIMDACLARDIPQARKLTIEHISRTVEAISDLLPSDAERDRGQSTLKTRKRQAA
jgi:GntR family transcriptional regulator, carbon starvation induced regulator